MTEVNKGNATHQRLISLLSEQGATYRVVSHEAVGKCGQFLKFVVPHWAGSKSAGLQSKRQRRQSACSGDPLCRSAGRPEPVSQPYWRVESVSCQPGGGR